MLSILLFCILSISTISASEVEDVDLACGEEDIVSIDSTVGDLSSDYDESIAGSANSEDVSDNDTLDGRSSNLKTDLIDNLACCDDNDSSEANCSNGTGLCDNVSDCCLNSTGNCSMNCTNCTNTSCENKTVNVTGGCCSGKTSNSTSELSDSTSVDNVVSYNELKSSEKNLKKYLANSVVKVNKAYELYVSQTGSDSEGNGSADNPFATIQYAYNYALTQTSSDVTLYIIGNLKGTGNANLTLRPAANLNIVGLNKEYSILNGEGSNFIFNFLGSSTGVRVSISNLTVINARSSDTYYSSIYSEYVQLIINDCIFTNNAGYSLRSESNSTVLVNNSRFVENYGGLIFASYSSGTVGINHVQCLNNNLTYSGSMISTGCRLLVNNLTATGNYGDNNLGNCSVIYSVYEETSTIMNSLFNNNSVAIQYNPYYDDTLTGNLLIIYNSTFNNNGIDIIYDSWADYYPTTSTNSSYYYYYYYNYYGSSYGKASTAALNNLESISGDITLSTVFEVPINNEFVEDTLNSISESTLNKSKYNGCNCACGCGDGDNECECGCSCDLDDDDCYCKCGHCGKQTAVVVNVGCNCACGCGDGDDECECDCSCDLDDDDCYCKCGHCGKQSTTVTVLDSSYAPVNMLILNSIFNQSGGFAHNNSFYPNSNITVDSSSFLSMNNPFVFGVDEKINISKTLFVNDDSITFAQANVCNSSLYNTTIYSVSSNSSKNSVNLSYNYWYQDIPMVVNSSGGLNLDHWIIRSLSSPTENTSSPSHLVNLGYSAYNGSTKSDYDVSSIPILNETVTYTVSAGSVTPNSDNLSYEGSNTLFSYAGESTETITATVSDGRIYTLALPFSASFNETNSSNPKSKSIISVYNVDTDKSIAEILLTDTDSNPLSNKTLYYSINNGSIKPLNTDSNGLATIKDLSDGINNITVLFTGDDSFYSASTSFTINKASFNKTKIATKLSFKNMTTSIVLSGSRNGEWFNVTLTDINGNPLANKSVLIGFNGKVYNKTTDEKGIAQLQINIGYQSANTFAITFLGDDDYTGCMDCAIIVANAFNTKLTTSKYSYKSAAKTKTLKATLKTTNGTLVSGQKITFKVNGQYYIATTNSKGVASVKVSLSAKKTYTYTASFTANYQYNSSTSTNKITIK